MKIIFRHTIFILTVILLLCISKEAQACSCSDYDVPVCEVYWKSDVVFTGSVIDITPDPLDRSDFSSTDSIIHFKIDQAFRGSVGNKILVPGSAIEVFAPEKTSCAMGFKVGQQWLVYANRISSAKLVTGPCNRTTQLPATEDLAYIMRQSDKSPTQSILGRVGKSQYDPLEGVKVIVEDQSNKYQLITDKEGKFKVDVPQAGSYKVRLFIPYSAFVLKISQQWEEVKSHPTEQMTTAEYDVTLAEGYCDYRSFIAPAKDLKATASIEGKVLDAEGQPVAGQRVFLYPATPEQDFSDGATGDVTTDRDGNYKLDELREGRYWLGTNLGRIPEVDEPYPATLYPGTQDINKATAITLKQGQKLSKKDIQLPAKLIEREIKGSVIWPDGRPALAAPPDSETLGYRPSINVRDPKRLWYPINPLLSDGRRGKKVDEGGHFSFIGLEGVTYVIWASAYDNEGKPWRSKAIKLKISGDTKPLLLKLTLPGGGNSKEFEKELAETP